MGCEGYGVYVSVCPSIYYHVFCHYAQQGNSDSNRLIAVTTLFSKEATVKLPLSKVSKPINSYIHETQSARWRHPKLQRRVGNESHNA